MKHDRYDAVVIGCSAGGLDVLKTILSDLPENYSMPIILVQHIGANSENYSVQILDKYCRLKAKEVEEKEHLLPGMIYMPAVNYHLLVELNHTVTLTTDPKVNYARPSIDVLFQTASFAYKDKLIGIILTGANFDGVEGLLEIKERGGLTIVQEPSTAEAKALPVAAVSMAKPDLILDPDLIHKKLIEFHESNLKCDEQVA